MRFLHSLWLVDCAAHLVILSLKGRLFLLPHCVNHLQRFTQLAQALRCIWKSIAIRSIFLLIPARTYAKVQATMAQHIKGAGHLRHQGRIVTCNSYRNPALVAKMSCTLDILSHGRLNFGIGAGWYEHEYKAYGYPYPDAPERLRMLREALQVIHAMWEQEEATFEGTYYQVRGAINQPKGVQKPHIPILIGGGGEKVTLKLVAQFGDACNVLGDLETIRHKLAVLKTHCETLGRDFATIHCTTGAVCSIAENDETALALLPPPVRNQLRDTSLVGSPQTIRQRIAALEEVGIHELILDFPTSATDLTPIHRFAREFVAQ